MQAVGTSKAGMPVFVWQGMGLLTRPSSDRIAGGKCQTRCLRLLSGHSFAPVEWACCLHPAAAADQAGIDRRDL